MRIFRSLSIVMVVAIRLNAMAPTLAHAATYLQGTEVNTNTLIRDAYVAVTYYDSKGDDVIQGLSLPRMRLRVHFLGSSGCV